MLGLCLPKIEQKKEDYRYYNFNIFQPWPNGQFPFLSQACLHDFWKYLEVHDAMKLHFGACFVALYVTSKLLGFHSVIVCRKSSCASWHCLASVNGTNFAPKPRVASSLVESLRVSGLLHWTRRSRHRPRRHHHFPEVPNLPPTATRQLKIEVTSKTRHDTVWVVI